MPDQDLAGEVAALHQRMDCFYSWATQLQHEIRELKRLQVGPEDPEAALRRRVDALRP
jgi:hypothetical protein